MFGGSKALRSGVVKPYVWELCFLRFGVVNPYVWELFFLRLRVVKPDVLGL